MFIDSLTIVEISYNLKSTTVYEMRQVIITNMYIVII